MLLNTMLPDQKCRSYMATTFGSSLMHKVFMFYYVKFYLEYFHISSWWFQMSQLVFLVWNTINDPLFGYFQDNSNWKCYRMRRLSILFGAPLYALSFLLIWYPWAIWNVETPPEWMVGVQLMLSLCFYDTLFTFVLLAHCSLFAEMSLSYRERLNMKWWGTVASLCATWAVPFCNQSSANLTNLGGFRVAALVIAVIALVAIVYTGVTAITVYEPANQIVASEGVHSEFGKSDHGSLLLLSKQILWQRDFLAFVFTNFLQISNEVFFANFTSIFVDHLAPFGSASSQSMFFFFVHFLPPMAIILGKKFIEKVGYFEIIRGSFAIEILLCASLFALGKASPTVFLFFLVMQTVLIHSTFALYDLVLSDLCDKDKLVYNRKHPVSSMIFATNALITKPSISLMPMLIVHLLRSNGYQSSSQPNKNHSFNALSTLPASTNSRDSSVSSYMFYLNCVVPALIAFAQLFIWSFYTIRSTHKQSDAHLQHQQQQQANSSVSKVLSA